MALWRVEYEYPDGSRESNVMAAGNRTAAQARAEAAAEKRGARLVGVPEVVDPVRGSM
ncbi:MAG TPA: hypothetical protein VNZ52_00345 [Candidatus Thermoplasmatota archaeon]|nr:hypothetical protein [Candidatus Thermoplasmatota archaeon]